MVWISRYEYWLTSLLQYITSLLKYMFPLIFQDPKIYVQTILDVHKKYNALVLTAFNNDAGFVASLDKVFLIYGVHSNNGACYDEGAPII